ncbi:hypothetical protein DM02DRAFT_609122 [Periconia macrospinosa]|uniref:A-kinase anchor protein 7-like phosphoesterase domain-containing protein n=1 Tax=Periconia macrospinosa TaxID=97972 RepID=A0A2V1E9E2_9PLEO|nr:hypothetical protein DM02DRAFT_609122 [Periconia macrospinosa]
MTIAQSVYFRTARHHGVTSCFASTLLSRSHRPFSIMGKKKGKGEYNDFLDGEKLRDNTAIRTSLQGASTLNRDASPPRHGGNRKSRGPTRGNHAPKKPQLTHFLCLPLVNEASRPQLEVALDKLKEELAQSGLVPLKAVRPLGTLHLTLGVMSLDAPQLVRAQQYLEDLDLVRLLHGITASASAEKTAESGENLDTVALQPNATPLRITLEALVPMQKPAQTSILYAEPRDFSSRLLAFAKALRGRFEGEGLMVEDKRDLKLHATIINTIYAKPKGKGSKHVGKQGGNRGELLTDSAHDDVSRNNDAASVTGSIHDDGGGGEAVVGGGTKSTALDGRDGHGPNAKSWMRFDARDLMGKYGDFVWARDVHIDRVQICKMGAAKILDGDGEVVDEKYEVVAEKVI